MKLSPGYLNFMTESVGLIFTQSLFIPIGPCDANALILIALYMGRDPEAHAEMKERLSDRGELISLIWDNFYKLIDGHNKAEISAAKIDVNELIRRVSSENNGKNAG